MRVIIGLLILLCFASLADASFISLTTSLSASFEGNKLVARVNVTNKGDESAYNVQAEMRVAGKTILSEKQSEVLVNGTYQAIEAIPLSFSKPGTYPLILTIHYTDANQYPFSALTGQLITYKQQYLSDLFGQLKPARFSKDGSIKLALKNSGDQAINGRLQLVIPKEITVKEDIGQLSIPPRAEKEVTVRLTNFSALPGSTYQAFAIIEYENADVHFSVVAPGTIAILEKNFFKDNQILLYALIIILLAIFLALQFKKKA